MRPQAAVESEPLLDRAASSHKRSAKKSGVWADNPQPWWFCLAAFGGGGLGTATCALLLLVLVYFVGASHVVRSAETWLSTRNNVQDEEEKVVAYVAAASAATLSKRLLRPSELAIDTSLDGETGFLLGYMAGHPEVKPQQKVVVDFGAYDCVTFSNSYNLIKDFGWRGVLVEPFPQSQEKCEQELIRLRSFGAKANLVHGFVGVDGGEQLLWDCGAAHTQVSGRPCKPGAGGAHQEPLHVQRHEVIALLEANQVPKDFGVLTIDVEDHALEAKLVAKVLNTGYHPMFIISEGVTKVPGYDKLQRLRYNNLFVRRLTGPPPRALVAKERRGH